MTKISALFAVAAITTLALVGCEQRTETTTSPATESTTPPATESTTPPTTESTTPPAVGTTEEQPPAAPATGGQ